MEPAMFYELLERITPRISKQTTNWRKPLDPGLKLAVTLRYLATGNSYHSLAFNFRVAHNSISIFVREVCEAIIEQLGEEVVSVPDTEDKWREVASKFETRWNFLHTLGAIDGKHIAMKSPTNSGTVYHNYKGFFSLILLGLVDADYKFVWVDVGANGSTSDCAVWNQSNLKASLENGTLSIPAPEPLPQDDIDMPYFIVGDDAFPLRTSMMKPFSTRRLTDEERIFNYRLSRARRIVENAFGILANRFRCLLTTMPQEPKTVTTIAMAAVCLHNVMRTRYPGLQNVLLDREREDHQVVPGAWREEGILQEMNNVGGTTVTKGGKRQRILLKHYVNTFGAVPWQQNML
jgi:hypothetical protein